MKSGQWIEPGSQKVLKHQEVMELASSAAVVLLGEQHDRPEQHRWQMHVLAGLFARREQLVVGYEMFPKRLDPVLERWSSGEFNDEDSFLAEAEWGSVWGFPSELYMPLFRFCRQFHIPLRGLNCRRPLVTEVGKVGWDNIPASERDGVTPAKPATEAYRSYLFNLTGGGPPSRKSTGPMDPAFDRFVRAQQVWDRSFACRIADLNPSTDGLLVAGIIGRGHLEYGHGTAAQLEDLGVSSVVTLLPHVSNEPPEAGLADAVFCIDPNEVM